MQQLKKRKPLNFSKMIALVFFLIILLGTGVLCLPASSRDGQCCGFLKALFTATSSTCVTGLVLADTWTQWSGLGQAVLLVLIEIGGLGFMTVASTVIFGLRRKMNMNQQMLIAQSIGADDLHEIVRIQKRILIGCIGTQGVGALILFLRFLSDFDVLKSLKLGIFHSVSAFCNAGFDILGFIEPGTSVAPYGTDAVVLLTLSFLIIIGGVGFLVWDEILRVRCPKKYSVYTKLVLITTGGLLLSGTVLTLLTEWNNPATLGDMTVPQKILAAFFQSSTLRTAGFAGFDQGGLTDGGKAVAIFHMLIGGSSGSTAGGLKTVSFVVLLLFLASRITGRDSVCVFHRTVPSRHVLNAVTLFISMVFLAFLGGTVICTTANASFVDGLYESVSAIATVGLTTGITTTLSIPAQLLMILFMYFGRIGILTFSIGFLQKNTTAQNFRYADTDLLIG